MSKLRRLGCLILFSVLATVVHAELVVLAYNGTAQSFVPSEVRRITFEAGKLCVLTHQGESYQMPVAEVQKCYFGVVPEVPTSIISLSKGRLSAAGNRLCVETAAKVTLTVANAEGKTVLVKHLSAGTTSVSLESLPVGIYVVTVGGETLKFLKR